MGPKKQPEPEPELSPEEEEERRRQQEELERQHAQQLRVVELREQSGRRLVEEMQEVGRKFVDGEQQRSRRKSSQGAPPRYTVHVKLLSGNRALPDTAMEFVCEPGETVDTLRQRIFEWPGMTRVPPENQRLTLRGREIVSGSLLEDNQVGPESTVHLSVVGLVSRKYTVPPVRCGRPLPTRDRVGKAPQGGKAK
eukprot:Hpha_TRINITY_DN8699_c0_g1::TRINITY_DN8699_c0_g1_i1::g.168865::m.168865